MTYVGTRTKNYLGTKKKLFSANGFVRSESTVAIFLQRAQDAKRQYAKLVFCDNFFEGLTGHCLLGYDDEYIKNSLREIYERNKSAALAQDIAFMELTGCAIKVEYSSVK